MKTILLIIISATLQVAGAQVVYTYNFDNNLFENNSGPDLTAVCSPSYSQHTFAKLGKITHTVCHFDRHCGFLFNDQNNFFSAGSYSIELYVELDSISGYRKLVDFKNLTDDNGLYDNDGACTFRGPGTVSGSFFINGTYNFVTLTRDGSSKDVRLYVNGQYVDGFNDNGSDYAVYNGNKMVRFLQDDDYSAGTESTAGNVALLRIYNYPLDPQTAINNYLNLSTVLAEPKPKKNHETSVKK